MPYKYAIDQQDYSDLSSGRVFYSLPGHPAFPVRLASEIFQRCLANRGSQTEPCSLYDPCCGAAYLLGVIGYLHRAQVRELIGSDLDEKSVALAKKNLGLLTTSGIKERILKIRSLLDQYHKDSHQAALESAYRWKQQMAESAELHSLSTKLFQSSAMDEKTILRNIPRGSIDIVLTDVPYGQHSQWLDLPANESDPIRQMLTAVLGVLSPNSVVAIVADKGQKISHPRYERVEQFNLGKRRAALLKPV